MALLEVVTYQVKPGISDSALLTLSGHFEAALKREVPGFQRRELMKCIDSDMWFELLWWDNEESARIALDKVTQTVEFKQYCDALVADGGDDIQYFSEVSVNIQALTE